MLLAMAKRRATRLFEVEKYVISYVGMYNQQKMIKHNVIIT